jgi:hypothetical protein
LSLLRVAALDGSEPHQALASTRNDNLFAGERAIDQRRKLRLCFGDIDLHGLAATSRTF